MSAEAVAATAGCVAILVSVIGGLLLLAYKAGGHSTRLTAVEEQIGKIKQTQDEHTRSLSVVDQMLDLLKDLRQDVKDILTGKTTFCRRRGAAVETD